QAIAETIEEFPLQVAANFYLGVTCFTLGKYRRTEDLCRTVVQSLAGDLSGRRLPLTEVPASGAHNYWALALAERGEFDEGIAHGQEAIRLAEVADHPFSLVLACWGLAHLYSLRGELNHAVRLLERGLALSREVEPYRPVTARHGGCGLRIRAFGAHSGRPLIAAPSAEVNGGSGDRRLPFAPRRACGRGVPARRPP